MATIMANSWQSLCCQLVFSSSFHDCRWGEGQFFGNLPPSNHVAVPMHASLLIVKTLSRQPLPSPSSAKKTLAKWGKHLHYALLDVNHLLHVLLFLDAVDHLVARPRTSHMWEMCTKLKTPKFETTTIWLRNLSILIGDVLNQEWCNPLSVHSRQGHSGK